MEIKRVLNLISLLIKQLKYKKKKVCTSSKMLTQIYHDTELLLNSVLSQFVLFFCKQSCLINKKPRIWSIEKILYLSYVSLFFLLFFFAVSNWMGLMGSTNCFRSWMRYCFSHFILSRCIKHT